MIKKKMVLGILLSAYGMFAVSSVETDVTDLNEYAIISAGAASFGNNMVTGKVCLVLKSKQLDKIRKGDIVIAPAIHSTWYPQLSIAAGIITEKGDESSNAIAFGKKLGIPVIVGVSDATKMMIDGQTIICDPITKNIYHVRYFHSPEPHFDALQIAQKNNDCQTLHDKLGKPGKVVRPAKLSIGVHDSYVPFAEDKNGTVAQNKQEYKTKRITKDVYLSHFNQFKKFALGVQSKYKWGKWFGALEAGARATGRDDFAIDCIPIGDVLLDSDEKHFENVLKRIGIEQYVQYMDLLIDKCTKKPGNITETNWIARVSHKEHVKAVANDIPADVDKEKLMEHPKEYKKIENKVNKDEREARIAAGLFALYWMENKLPL